MNKKFNNQIKIKINYSLSLEVKRVFNIIKRIDWYIDNDYAIDLPYGLKERLDTTKKISKKQIFNLVKPEFNVKDFYRTKSIIKKRWPCIAKKIQKNLPMTISRPSKLYKIILTRYGTGGSYSRPSKVIINFNKRAPERILSVIIHEIIHLLIEKFIVKYKISHWYKERIVDLIFVKIDSDNSKEQKIPIDVSKVDEIFYKFYPDIEKIIKNLR